MTTTQPLAPIHACPNPECGQPCALKSHIDFYRVECTEKYCYIGPSGNTKEAAIRKHNLICERTPSVLPGAGREAIPYAWVRDDAFVNNFSRGSKRPEGLGWFELYKSSPPSSVQAEAVAWVIKLRGEYQCVTTDPLIKMARESDGYTSEPLYAAPIQAPGIVAELQKLVEKCKWEADKTSSQQFKLRTAYKWFASELSSLIKAVGEER